YQNCDFLSIERQKLLNFKITNSLPYKSYARKNLGYLYAILNGAKFIYETDDDN
ncbi:glycosyltransferase STELLO1, partial [Biomphalaria pfeifferi]